VRREDPDQVVRDVGRRVAELRQELGLTQERFAENLGVHPRYLARIERGGQNLTLHRLVWLAGHLGVHASDLMLPPCSREVRVGRPPGQRNSQLSTRRRG
jgi:transcriptional regulator with XRE-family HTH domain